jgi:hypothetical protein
LHHEELNAQAFYFYGRFRAEVPADERGWDAVDVLDLAKTEALVRHR